MDVVITTDIAVFLFGAFVAAFVTGLAGFAFGIVAAAIWLHVLPPSQATVLIIVYALIVQGHAVWKLRASINLSRLLPFVLGSAIGIPFGIALLHSVPDGVLRTSIGVMLILFSVFNLARLKMPVFKQAGRAVDGGIGVLNGVVGAATGLAGIVPVIWSGMRGWTRDEQRAVFQPTGVATFAMALVAFGGSGLVTLDTVRLFTMGLPAIVAGMLGGWVLYGRLDEAMFRKVVLVLLLLSGLSLLVSGR